MKYIKILRLSFFIIFSLAMNGCGGKSESEDGTLFGDSDTITSSLTGRVWMNKNLGATRVCNTYYDDERECIGDYYQWGREADGHEKSYALTTTVKSPTVDATSSDGKYIEIIKGDWTYDDSDGSIRSWNWSKTDGSSVCPVGFRVPTREELASEYLEDIEDAFKRLKLPESSIWSSTPSGNEEAYQLHLFYISTPETMDTYRANGNPIRCIQD